ncbi:odorant binding protein 6 [Megachile rotundata]|uniref:odorant binding protein 6 n=1 Tax=Megachile rotundata TaxID=143995 RepID=UPI003FCFABF7
MKKLLLLVAMLVSVAFNPVNGITQEQMEKMAKGMRTTCLQKIDTTEELVAGIRRGEFPDDQNLKCYTHCIMKIMRSFKNGGIDFAMIKKQIDMSMPEDLAVRMKDGVNACSKNEYTGDQCDIAYKYQGRFRVARISSVRISKKKRECEKKKFNGEVKGEERMKGYSVVLLVALMMVLLSIKDTESKKMTIEEAKKSVKNLRKTCSKKTDAPKELLDGQHKGEFPKEESLMCYLRCILTATKFMKNDVMNWEFFAKSSRVMLLEEYVPRVDHIIEVCEPQATSTDGCELAWQIAKCIWETDSEMYMAP